MRRAVLAFALSVSAAVPLAAQTAEEIVARYVQTIGGTERIQAVHTLRRAGTFYGGGGFQAQLL